MSKKLSNNGLWESSRMMLPEHREAIIRTQSMGIAKKRPELDSQELELIATAIRESYTLHIEITLILYNEYENKIITGTVVGVDYQRGRIKVQTEDEIEPIKINKIIGVR